MKKMIAILIMSLSFSSLAIAEDVINTVVCKITYHLGEVFVGEYNQTFVCQPQGYSIPNMPICWHNLQTIQGDTRFVHRIGIDLGSAGIPTTWFRHAVKDLATGVTDWQSALLTPFAVAGEPGKFKSSFVVSKSDLSGFSFRGSPADRFALRCQFKGK